ncbi:Coiled-coil domain-containing protein [Porites harrisoni]
MEGDIWANFGPVATNSQNASIDDDDDWADFGGFESATPAVNGSSQSGSVIQWATVGVPPPGESSHATSSPHPVSSFTPPFLTSAATESTKTSNLPMPNPQDHSDFINSFLSSDEDFSAPVTSESSHATAIEDDKTEYDSFHADFSSFLSEALSETYQPFSSASQFGDVKAGSSTDNTSKAPGSLVSMKTKNEANGEDVGITAVLEQSQESAPDTFDGPENEVSTAQDILLVSQKQPSAVLDKSAGSNHKELSQQLLVAAESKKKLEDTVKGLEGKLSFVEQEKLQLQKDLESLLQRNKSLVEESENLTESLAKQREKYEQLQDQHKKEIEEIRKAGHDALAVIVEEYKELSRKAVLEQQEKNKIQMESILEDQRKKFQEFLQEQQDSFERRIQEESNNSTEKANSLLEEEKKRHKEQIEYHLEEERLKSKEALKKAVEESRQEGLEAVEIARKEERQKYEEFVTEYKESVKSLTDQEGKRLQTLVEATIKEQKESNKAALEDALAEERKRGKEFADEIKDETKKEMLQYIRAKQEADRAARQKHLHGLDLFLESARAQLKALMDDQTELDPSETSGL